MDLSDSPEQARYRETVRALARRAPRRRAAVLERSNEDDAYIAARRALAGRARRGRPRRRRRGRQEYGGQGLGPIEHVIVNQEISAAGVPGILDTIGVGMLGPTLIAHGTDAQKARYLGPMLHGDEVWCQLFSEPAAGSDLAGIQARARRAGRRLVAPQRPEGVDDERPVRVVRTAARAHRPRRAQAQGPDDVRRADGRGRA